jgi:hypothetical protein
VPINPSWVNPLCKEWWSHSMLRCVRMMIFPRYLVSAMMDSGYRFIANRNLCCGLNIFRNIGALENVFFTRWTSELHKTIHVFGFDEKNDRPIILYVYQPTVHTGLTHLTVACQGRTELLFWTDQVVEQLPGQQLSKSVSQNIFGGVPQNSWIVYHCQRFCSCATFQWTCINDTVSDPSEASSANWKLPPGLENYGPVAREGHVFAIIV